jgi:alpha-beta hydrolase superfamily lysophospholipase
MIRFRDELYDAQLLRALGHAPYRGAAIGECLAAAAQVKERDRTSWHDAWRATADRTLAEAEASASRDRRVSAVDAFLRASNYHRTAYVFHLERPLPAIVREGYRFQREAFSRAARLMSRPLERLSIPFEGGSLPGWFCSAGFERRPLVVSVGGYDSTAEESYFWNAAPAVARGYHALTFDGPGQGGALIEQGLTFRPEWASVLSAVLDFAAARADVDAKRIAVIGESFGGYLAPLAAARDPRIAACVLDPAQRSLLDAFRARLPLPAAWKRDLPHGPRWIVAILRTALARTARAPTAGWALRRGMLTHGVDTPWDYALELARYTGAALTAIRCPTLVCDAAEDEIAASARSFFEALTCDKEYVRFEANQGAADHCIVGNRPLFHARVFDWLDGRLAPSIACEESGAAVSRPESGFRK